MENEKEYCVPCVCTGVEDSREVKIEQWGVLEWKKESAKGQLRNERVNCHRRMILQNKGENTLAQSGWGKQTKMYGLRGQIQHKQGLYGQNPSLKKSCIVVHEQTDF